MAHFDGTVLTTEEGSTVVVNNAGFRKAETIRLVSRGYTVESYEWGGPSHRSWCLEFYKDGRRVDRLSETGVTKEEQEALLACFETMRRESRTPDTDYIPFDLELEVHNYPTVSGSKRTFKTVVPGFRYKSLCHGRYANGIQVLSPEGDAADICIYRKNGEMYGTPVSTYGDLFGDSYRCHADPRPIKDI